MSKYLNPNQQVLKQVEYREHYQPGDTILVYYRPDQGIPHLGFIEHVHDNGVDAYVPSAGGRKKGIWAQTDERLDDSEVAMAAWGRGLFIDTEQTALRKDIKRQLIKLRREIADMKRDIQLIITPSAKLSKYKKEQKARIMSEYGFKEDGDSDSGEPELQEEKVEA